MTLGDTSQRKLLSCGGTNSVSVYAGVLEPVWGDLHGSEEWTRTTSTGIEYSKKGLREVVPGYNWSI